MVVSRAAWSLRCLVRGAWSAQSRSAGTRQPRAAGTARRLWDPATGRQVAVMQAHVQYGWLSGVTGIAR
jgi:hypothetical protein